MGNIKTITSYHNKTEINKFTCTNNQKKNCNCQKPNSCPMDGHCNAENEFITTIMKET